MISTLFQQTPKIVSFDFDDTLSMPIYKIPDDYSEFSFDNPTKISSRMKSLIQELAQAGSTIYLVTSRKDTSENRDEVVNFLKENQILDFFQDLIFTGDDKASTLQQIGSEVHFDDDEYEFRILKDQYPETQTKFVQIKHPEEPGIERNEENWEFKVLNSLRKELNKRGFEKASSQVEELLKKWL